jgi:hypothetical protein
MEGQQGSFEFGEVKVLTTTNRGFTPEEIAERALNKIISVGESSHPAIRDQAVAFQDYIRQVLVYYMYEAIKSDRTTQAVKLRESGHPELVNLLNQ